MSLKLWPRTEDAHRMIMISVKLPRASVNDRYLQLRHRQCSRTTGSTNQKGGKCLSADDDIRRSFQSTSLYNCIVFVNTKRDFYY